MIYTDENHIPFAFFMKEQRLSLLGNIIRLRLTEDHDPTYHFVRSIAPHEEGFLYRLGQAQPPEEYE